MALSRQQRAYVFAMVAVLLWSTVAAAFKVSLQHLDFLQLLFFAALVSNVVLFVLVTYQKKLGNFKTFKSSDYIQAALLGLLNPFLYYVLLFKAYTLLPAQVAQPLNYTWPIMLAILAVPLLKQPLSKIGLLGIVISFFGVLIISTKGDLLGLHFPNMSGALMALATAVIWALFWILNLRTKGDQLPRILLNFIFGFIYITVATILFSEISLPSTAGIGSVLYVGLFEMGFTFVIWSKALELSSSASKVSKLIYLVPFLSLIVIYYVLGEKIHQATIFGLILIVVGIGLDQLSTRAKISNN